MPVPTPPEPTVREHGGRDILRGIGRDSKLRDQGNAMALPQDYLERVYAGVLGKLIGVYLGRPFEGWTHERIMRELGPIEYYVHERLGQPLVVTDDDVAGTFTFVRALEDLGRPAELASQDVGKAWLNYIVEKRSILWWGGNGISTEHTAWLNLNKGLDAPESGSIAVNGRTIAEQIGAQIFIDGWAMVAPGRPLLAARLAREAARVSHDGEAVHAAMLWAAMEAEAFLTADIDRLIDTGLSVIPADCLIARLIADIRAWHRSSPDWRDTRQRIADTYGYDKFAGHCHIVPNHALMIMAVLHAPDDFQRAQTIVNTSGWDTDCNAGNVGCLLGLMLGLDGLDAGPDWRGPLADRMLISSADGGFSINDAVRLAGYIAGLGHAIEGSRPPVAPKRGAQFHFSLPGSTQGFRIADGSDRSAGASVAGARRNGEHVLAIGFDSLGGGRSVVATTPTFAPREILRMRTYDLMATPLVYPGQVLSAGIRAAEGNTGEVEVRPRLRRYGEADGLVDVDGPALRLDPGRYAELAWTLPDCAAQPIAEIGLAVTAGGAESGIRGEVLLDRMGWEGAPDLTLRCPAERGEFWRRAWVDAADTFSGTVGGGFRISRERGEGLIVHGTREWTDYELSAGITVHLGRYAGLTARTRGLRRFYAARIRRGGRFEILRVLDDEREVLAAADLEWRLDETVPMTMTLRGGRISASAGEAVLSVDDGAEGRLASGGIGLLIADGAVSADMVRVRAPD